MYFSQILPQQQTLAPVTTSFVQVQPQQSFSYIQVPQTQQLSYMTPQLVQPAPMAMPGQLYQCPTYDKFIPPTPISRSTTPKIYQFYKYVPVIQQQDFGTIPAVQPVAPAYQTMSVPAIPSVNYSYIQ